MEILLTVLAYLGIATFVAVLFLGALLTLLGLPGTVLIFLDALIYSAATGWKLPGWLLLVLLGISLFAEVSDNIVSAVGVKKYGGSTKGMFWALMGGLAGAVLFGAVLGPLVPVVGAIVAPIVGGLLGGFAGGYWYEKRQGRSEEEAKRAGMGAMLGRVAGTMLKAVSAAVMVIVVLMNAFG